MLSGTSSCSLVNLVALASYYVNIGLESMEKVALDQLLGLGNAVVGVTYWYIGLLVKWETFVASSLRYWLWLQQLEHLQLPRQFTFSGVLQSQKP